MSSMEKGNREISNLPPYEEEALFNGRYVSYSTTSRSVNNTPSIYQEKQQSKIERICRNHFPVFLEFLCSYTLTVVAFNSRANPATFGLVYAGLAHMASTGSSYLQANPVLTLGQLARGHIDLATAGLNMAAQLVGVLLAALTFWCAAGGSLHETALPSITTCDTVPWRSALLTQSVFTAVFTYVALSAWDSTALELSNMCTFYGLCVGTSSYASITGIQCRGMGSGLLNPWVGALGFFCDPALVPCRGVHMVGPLLGGVIGVLLSWLTSLTGSEKEAILRSMAPLSPLVLEMAGVTILVLSLGITNAEPTGAYLVALTFISWRRSGSQFSPALTLSIYLLKRNHYQWSSLLWFTAAQVLGAFVGVLLLVSMPVSRQAVPALDETIPVSLMDFVLVFVYSVVWAIIFISATEAEFEEGFLHPPLLAALSLIGLVQAYSPDPVVSALYNPAITLALGVTVRAFGSTIIILVAQLLAAPVACSFFWVKSRLDLL